MSDFDSLEIGLCWGTLQNADLLELIEAAGRHGFPTLSVRPDMILGCIADVTGEASLRKRLVDAGVRVRVIDALTVGLPGMPETSALRISGRNAAPANEDICFRAAQIVEAPIINIALFGGRPAPIDELSEAIAGICDRAAGQGLEIVLEFIPDTAIPDIHVARDVLKACGAPNCRVLLDTWHLARSQGALEDVIALPPGVIGAYQLCDRIPPPPGAPYVPMTGRDLPGEGRLPLHAITRAALAANPGLTAEIEVFSAELRDMPVDAAAARVARAVNAWRADL